VTGWVPQVKKLEGGRKNVETNVTGGILQVQKPEGKGKNCRNFTIKSLIKHSPIV